MASSTSGSSPVAVLRDACARVAHEANRAYCLAIGDDSQAPWESAPDWQRASARAGVLVALQGATPEQQHESWCAAKRADGWTWGATKDADAKTHPCLIAYRNLPAEQRRKDALFGAVVRAMAEALDLRCPECLDRPCSCDDHCNRPSCDNGSTDDDPQPCACQCVGCTGAIAAERRGETATVRAPEVPDGK